MLRTFSDDFLQPMLYGLMTLFPPLWVPEAQVFTWPAENAYPPFLSFSTGPISFSFSAESLALVHSLEWWHSQTAIFNRPFLFFPRPGISPTKILLGYLGLFLLCSFKLPVGLRSCWIPR